MINIWRPAGGQLRGRAAVQHIYPSAHSTGHHSPKAVDDGHSGLAIAYSHFLSIILSIPITPGADGFTLTPAPCPALPSLCCGCLVQDVCNVPVRGDPACRAGVGYT